MPSIKPFKGIVYNPDSFKDISPLVAPPYDVIPREMQSRLYSRSPYNIVRLALGKTKSSDGINDNRYTRAERFFKSWLKNHIMIQDKKEAFYIYSQKYKVGEKDIERLGFIGLMRLDRSRRKKVLPHENTLLEPKLDRLSLMRSIKANLEPIFVLYEDRPHRVLNILKRFCSNEAALIDAEFDGVRNRFWRLDDKGAIKRIGSLMRPKDIIIADGHHRYEVALTYSVEAEGSSLSDELKSNSKFLMAYFAELNERTLTILPSHRVIKDIGILKDKDIKDRLKRFFYIKRASNLNSLILKLDKFKNSYTFGMYLKKDGLYALRLKDIRVSDRLIKNNSRVWKRLDVTILHLFILEEVLGIRDDDDNVEFVKEPEKAVALVNRGCHGAAFFLRPTRVSQVKRVAELGERMPRKATYFHPKPLSGLVINKLY